MKRSEYIGSGSQIIIHLVNVGEVFVLFGTTDCLY